MIDNFSNIPLPVRLLKSLTIKQAASVLINYNPYWKELSAYAAIYSEYLAFINLIMEAIDNEELGQSLHVMLDDSDAEFILATHEAGIPVYTDDCIVETSRLAAWCDRKGIPHPFITDKAPSPTQDSNAALQEAQVKIAQLQQQLEEKQRELDSLKPVEASQEPSNGLHFPYSTPELKVMQKAAVKYWASYDPEINTAEPLQKTIGHYIEESLGFKTSNNGEPRRFAAELAKAIKPEKYKD